MLGKGSRPVIEILTGPLLSGHRTSPQFESSKNQSPRSGPKAFDLGGIGLGIVAALQNSSDGFADIQVDRNLVSRSLRRSFPDPMATPIRGVAVGEFGRKGDDQTPFRIQSVFHISTARYTDTAPGLPASDFLNSCNLCGKKLHGKDIYIYRGEKAFCSAECRHRQIAIEEPKEKCSTGAASCPAGQMFSDGVLAA